MKTEQAGQFDCRILNCDLKDISQITSVPVYNILLIQGSASVDIDFTTYQMEGNVVLFATPYQTIQFNAYYPFAIRALQFHGDFYCIEFHKKEVACNGLLFNDIYKQPFINLDDKDFTEIHGVLDKLNMVLAHSDAYSLAIARAYLQLVLALCSKAKSTVNAIEGIKSAFHPIMEFKPLLEKYFLKERQPAFYAAQIGLSPNTFSKRCKLLFNKTPSALIQGRVILEAKKHIHLSYKSMKEVAALLNFDDENYFSRYFKKHTGITPTAFRDNVGVSMVADLSR